VAVSVTLLAIESATDLVGAALIRDDGAAAERVHEGGRAHAELLAPAIEEVCAVSGCTIGDVDHISVDVGPGLFTGLRVGVATAKALAQALGVGILGISSLDILAAAGAEELFGTGSAGSIADDGVDTVDTVDTVVSVVDARRGEVFAAAYRFDRGSGAATDPRSTRDDRLEPIGPEALVDWLVGLAQVAGSGSDGSARVIVVGDGAVRYRHLLSIHPSLDLRWAERLSAPPPVAQGRLALRRLADGVRPVSAFELVPDYRRPADARINWEQRAPRTVGSKGPERG
jgi:tRNA threonylcarbamoyladenosine biosynthesis protein TsaB